MTMTSQRWRRSGAASLVALGIVAIGAWVAPRAEAQDQPLDFGGTVIVGEVLTPEVTVFISRENLVKDYNIVFEESFLQKIVDSLALPPF